MSGASYVRLNLTPNADANGRVIVGGMAVSQLLRNIANQGFDPAAGVLRLRFEDNTALADWRVFEHHRSDSDQATPDGDPRPTAGDEDAREPEVGQGRG